jgi:hypothetical protein
MQCSPYSAAALLWLCDAAHAPGWHRLQRCPIASAAPPLLALTHAPASLYMSHISTQHTLSARRCRSRYLTRYRLSERRRDVTHPLSAALSSPALPSAATSAAPLCLCLRSLSRLFEWHAPTAAAAAAAAGVTPWAAWQAIYAGGAHGWDSGGAGAATARRRADEGAWRAAPLLSVPWSQIFDVVSYELGASNNNCKAFSCLFLLLLVCNSVMEIEKDANHK